VARPRPAARRRRAVWALGAALLGLLALAVLAGRGAGRSDPAARDQPPRDPISRVIREIEATRTAALPGPAAPTPAPSPPATPPATPTTVVATPPDLPAAATPTTLASTAPPTAAPPTAAPPTVTPRPNPTPTGAPTPPPTPAFRATDRVAATQPVNLRAGPGVAYPTQGLLVDGTPLAATGEAREVDGVLWRRFALADGRSGWIRDIDVLPAGR